MSLSSTTGLPVTPPSGVTQEAAEFWAGTARGELRLQRCASCNSVVWYPRGLCPVCLSSDLVWFTASGRGTVYSFSINRKGDGEFKETSPFVLAYVELEEGPRILTNVVGDPESVEIGMPVSVVFDDTGADMALVRFAPA